MSLRLLLTVLLSLGAWLLPASAQEFDLVLTGGRIIDGTGNPARFADVAIKDGRIVGVGRPGTNAAEVIDVSGLIVAPGFIDVHTHAENIFTLPSARNFARMGVTTLVLGNCGSSEVNVGRMFERIEQTNVAVNVATLLGQGSVRSHVMGGSFLRPPTAAELNRMKALVRQAMEDGALGLSTGLIYLPGTFTKTEEILELARVAGEFGGIYASHMRNEGDEILGSLEELFTIAREARLPAHVSHLKLGGRNNWGRTTEVLQAIADARATGLDITQDVYAYTASSTGVSSLIPEEAREGGKFKERMADPGQRADVIARMQERADERGGDFSYAVIASYEGDPKLNGLTIKEAALRTRGDDSLEAQIDTILEIQLNGGAAGVFHSMNEEDLRAFMRHPNTMLAADSSVRTWQHGVPHPRGYGNNARVLGSYVREEAVLSLEEAIRRMTSLPATTFRIKDRGMIREGAWADLAVFDPATVRDNATFEQPHQYATGFRLVLVNGRPIVENDGPTGHKPGAVVRRGQ